MSMLDLVAYVIAAAMLLVLVGAVIFILARQREMKRGIDEGGDAQL
jgi:hypothetical protein